MDLNWSAAQEALRLELRPFEAGWSAVSATSTERGLLRSPGRYQATVASLLELCSERGADFHAGRVAASIGA